MKEISGWGNYPKQLAQEKSFDSIRKLNSIAGDSKSLIARGNARSYGDSSINHKVVSTLRYNRMLLFDEAKGVFKCESGVLFSEILETIVPKGWFLPVTPGTKFITVGGAIASDVHGKNHHKEGSFSNHLLEFEILSGDGKLRKCSRDQNSDLFNATCGGMGLSGIILNATFNLKPIESSYITQKQIKAKNLDEVINLFEQYDSYTYTMAWIDCLKGGKGFGRSILICGEHTPLEELNTKQRRQRFNLKGKPKLRIPFNFPSFTLNKLSIQLFNALYYAKNIKKEINSIVPYEPFFYPLDSILSWNKMYGKTGFVQYQFVLPKEGGQKGLIEILDKIRRKGMGSFLAVLKAFGNQNDLISFPMEGLTLALDFPIKKGLFEFLDELDSIVLKYNGRIYLTKDARMKSEVFKASYEGFEEWSRIIKKYNPTHQFASNQSQRLKIT
ncbi:MAG: FAD-binding oxidoreductase [Bacteroidota bacterium]